MYNSLLLKISGEALASPNNGPLDPSMFAHVVREIRAGKALGTKISVVTGAGNLFRARTREAFGIDQRSADQIGMTAIDVNAFLLAEILSAKGMRAKALSAIGGNKFITAYDVALARHLHEEGTVVVCGGGTGEPFVTSDAAAIMRADDLHCEVVLKGSNVDGVYDSDPDDNPLAKRYDRLSYHQALEERLGVMDREAFEMARERHLPIIVYNLKERGALERIVMGEKVGTIID